MSSGKEKEPAKDNEDATPEKVRRYHPGICVYCGKNPSDSCQLKKCTQCQLVLYCSRVCQKKDWNSHKPLCQTHATKDGKNIFYSAKDKIQDKKGWLDFKNALRLNACLQLGRKLEPFENEIFLYARVCEVCGESDATKIIDCPKCHSVFYCSDTHRKKDAARHLKWCGLYALCIMCDLLEYNSGMTSLPFPIIVETLYKPLPSTIKQQVDCMLEFLPNNQSSEKNVLITLMTERLTYPLSLLYALQNLKVGPSQENIGMVRELTVHIVGAESTREMLGIIRWEYLLHILPALKKLHAVFVGPEVFSETILEENVPDNHCIDDTGMMRCEDCKEKGRHIIYEMCKMLYHEYTSAKFYTKPNVIIAFNSGFHEFEGEERDTWPKSLPKMVQDPNIPLIFTSYNFPEAEKDLEVLKGASNVEIIMGSQVNPYKSLRPYRDPAREENSDLFFTNHYITCVKGAK